MTETLLIEQVATRILTIQKSYVALDESFKEAHNSFDRKISDTALKLIDILDLIEVIKINADNNNANSTSLNNELVVIKKIERRLIEVLKSLQILEIVFKDNKIDTDGARVIEARLDPELESGTILEICRKGYRLGAKIIRPADVITVKND